VAECSPIRERNIKLRAEEILIFDQDGAELDDEDVLNVSGMPHGLSA
jgi:hypothetical protein